MANDLVAVSVLADGSVAMMAVQEVLQVPESPRNSAERTAFLEFQQGEARSMVADIYQVYAQLADARSEISVSAEVQWHSVPVADQAFDAEVRIFIVSRALGRDRTRVDAAVQQMQALIRSSLRARRYLSNPVAPSDVTSLMPTSGGAVALVKREWLDSVGLPNLPQIVRVDPIPAESPDGGRLAAILADTPGVCVRMMLIPTHWDWQERRALDDVTQLLRTLDRGVQSQQVGNISFVKASEALAGYEHYSTQKDAPLFEFAIVVSGPDRSLGAVISRVRSMLAHGSSRGLSMMALPIPNELERPPTYQVSSPWLVGEELSQVRDVGLWQGAGNFAALPRLPQVMSQSEATVITALPFVGDGVGAGLQVNRVGAAEDRLPDEVVGSPDLRLGALAGGAGDVQIGLPLRDLTKHMLVVGTPGSGKTTFTVGLLADLWRTHHIPFLVLEPAKNEYRAMLDIEPDLQIFTPGKSHVSPFVFNPFLPPEGVRLENYKSSLKTAFAAGVTLTSPLDRIFTDSVNRAYAKYGWRNSHVAGDGGEPFSIREFVRVFQETFDRIGYTGDAQNIGRAGLVRLQAIQALFDTEKSIPIGDLLSRPSLIELAAIENSEEKALYIALLLLSVLSYVNANVKGDGQLKAVIVLEEAHVLLAGSGSSGDSAAGEIAKDLVQRILAELRSYGIAMIIADQSPRKVGVDVVALTGTKAVFRVVEESDRRLVGASSNMSEGQINRLAELRPGEVIAFLERVPHPMELRVADRRHELGIRTFIDDAEVGRRGNYWQRRPDLLRPFAACDGVAGWDPTRNQEASEIAWLIMDRTLPEGTGSREKLSAVYRALDAHMEAVSGSPLPANVRVMVRVYFLRAALARTDLGLTSAAYQATLQKLRKD